jgi:soluble lytic murein transglycosylase-like protein
MPRNKRRRAAAARRSFDFQPHPRRKSRKGRPGRFTGWALSILFLAGSCGLFFVGWKLRGRVFNLRVGRAYESALQVLKQTQRPQAEQERYASAIARNAVEKGLSPAVVSAIVVVESSGNPLTVSPSGDLGLMQVNARIHARQFDFERRNLLNPEENIDVGTSILKAMADRHGNEKAIQAYNGLLPEKREYSVRVQAVLARAGFSPENELVAPRSGIFAQISDWIAAATASSGS